MRSRRCSPTASLSIYIMAHAPDTNSSSKGIIVSICGFVFGILVSSFIFVPAPVSVFLLLVALAVILAEKISKRILKAETVFMMLVLTAFSFGTLRYNIKDFHEAATPSLAGVVISEPEQRENATRFVFRSDNNEKVLVSTGLYSPVQYGDRIGVQGKLAVPGIIENEDGGRDFDYAKYLSKDDIYHTMSFAKVEVLESGEGSAIKTILLKIKRSFVNQIKEILAEPYASLLAGLLVSGRDAMPAGLLEEFRRAGIIHIVVLSGFNITVIAEFMRKLFRNNALALLGILLFVIMTGAEATVVRASLMVTAVVAAKMTKRQFSAPRALLLAGFIMLLENPKILVFDPAFQLSFLATLALIYVVPIIDKYLSRGVLTMWEELRSIIATTIGTQLTVSPLLIYSMGDFSLVSMPANVLVLLMIPFTMLAGFLATI